MVLLKDWALTFLMVPSHYAPPTLIFTELLGYGGRPLARLRPRSPECLSGYGHTTRADPAPWPPPLHVARAAALSKELLVGADPR